MSGKFFILAEYSYTEEEAKRADEIRKMADGSNKNFTIGYFEAETGKKFPTSEPIEIALNVDAMISRGLSANILSQVLGNGLVAKKSIT